MSVLDIVEPDDRWDECGAGILAAVGIPDEEERVYLFVLDRPGATPFAIARGLAMSRDTCERATEGLVRKGLVVTDPGPLPRYRAVAPDVAIEALVAQQQGELARTRVAAVMLRERARQAAGSGVSAQDDVEWLTGGLAVAQRLWQLQVTAEREVMSIGLPADSVSPVGGFTPAGQASLSRGVLVRALLERDSLGHPGALDAIRALFDAGGAARVAPIPTPMLMVDGLVAALPSYADGELTGAVVVRSTPVVSVLAAMFEVTWSHATPLVFTSGGDLVAANGAEASIVPMLVAGCKDESIARQLGVSTRTLDRRIRALMDSLGAVTRFQAGWLAAEQFGAATGK